MDKHMGKWKNWDALRTGLLTAIAVMLVMSAVMGSAWAYFTTYATAKGGVTLHMGHEEHVDEEFNSWEKTINIASTDDSRPVYLRARAYCAEYDVSYSNSRNWTRIDDWMYYDKTLAPGKDLAGSGDQLKVRINDVPRSTDVTLKDGQTFNVIVVYESTEIQYDKDGNPIAPQEADWNAKVDTTRRSTTLGGGN